MENVFVLFLNAHMVGIYTSHRKATQTLIMDVTRKSWKLFQYQYDFGVEYFSYEHDEIIELYEIQEVTLDARV